MSKRLDNLSQKLEGDRKIMRATWEAIEAVAKTDGTRVNVETTDANGVVDIMSLSLQDAKELARTLRNAIHNATVNRTKELSHDV